MSTPGARQPEPGLRDRVRELYLADTPRAHRFRYGLLAFDIATVVYVVATSFLPHSTTTEVIDAVLGLFILADVGARFWITGNPMRLFLQPATYADLVALASFLAPVAGEGFGFLRVLRTVRLLRTYRVAARLRDDFDVFRRHEDLVLATVNLGVFVFIMTGIVYETQHRTNPQIGNYADALYFTVTALTTTGFGDITLPGTTGRLISIVVMIFGVTLFLRLAQVLFRPQKVRHECQTCGLLRHDWDAIHCKHCGTTLHIRTEGGV